MVVKLALALLLFTSLSAASPIEKPAATAERNFKGYTECRKQEDCPRGSCCILGMQRYSVPTCFPQGIKDDPCMPSQRAPQNFSLSYPNTREAVEVQSAYLLLCPCDLNWTCDRDSNSCQDPAFVKSKLADKTQTPNLI